MKLVSNKGLEIPIYNTKKPKMISGHRGRTWDLGYQIFLCDNQEISICMDSTWGEYGYFDK